MPATDWKAATGGVIDTSWRASDDPDHTPTEALELNDSITLLHTAATSERATVYTFQFSIPTGATIVGIEVMHEGGYGPVGGSGGG